MSAERDILEYLAEHPDACGTIEDIVEWWILEASIRRATNEAKAAVERLVASGVVCADKLSDGKTYYSMNRENLNQILSPDGRRFRSGSREIDGDCGS